VHHAIVRGIGVEGTHRLPAGHDRRAHEAERRVVGADRPVEARGEEAARVEVHREHGAGVAVGRRA
jgi:hypothetical protein